MLSSSLQLHIHHSIKIIAICPTLTIQQVCGHQRQRTCPPPLPYVPVPPFPAAWCVGGPWWWGAGPPGPWRSSTPSCKRCPHYSVVRILYPKKIPKSLCKDLHIILVSTMKYYFEYRWRKKVTSGTGHYWYRWRKKVTTEIYLGQSIWFKILFLIPFCKTDV